MFRTKPDAQVTGRAGPMPWHFVVPSVLALVIFVTVAAVYQWTCRTLPRADRLEALRLHVKVAIVIAGATCGPQYLYAAGSMLAR